MDFEPSAAIFDLDGTLVEFPLAYLFEETNRVLRQLLWPEVEHDLLRTYFADFDYFGFIEQSKREDFIKCFWKEFDGNGFPSPVLLPGTLECLKALTEQGISIALATAREASEPELREILRHTGILDYVSLVVPRDVALGDNWMDKTRHVEKICTKLRLRPAQTMMIGDIPPDIESGKRAGVGLTVAVLSGGINRDVLQYAQPDVILDDVAQIPQYLRAIR